MYSFVYVYVYTCMFIIGIVFLPLVIDISNANELVEKEISINQSDGEQGWL